MHFGVGVEVSKTDGSLNNSNFNENFIAARYDDALSMKKPDKFLQQHTFNVINLLYVSGEVRIRYSDVILSVWSFMYREKAAGKITR